jgi:hypothetical protein
MPFPSKHSDDPIMDPDPDKQLARLNKGDGQGLISLEAAQQLWDRDLITGISPSERKNAIRDGYVMVRLK